MNIHTCDPDFPTQMHIINFSSIPRDTAYSTRAPSTCDPKASMLFLKGAPLPTNIQPTDLYSGNSNTLSSRDQMLLRAGDTLILIVSGRNNGDKGRFQVSIRGKASATAATPNLGPDQYLCWSQVKGSPIAFNSGANNNNKWFLTRLYPQGTTTVDTSVGPSISFTLPSAGHFQLVSNSEASNPQGGSCTDKYDTLELFVSSASLFVQGRLYENGDTVLLSSLSIPFSFEYKPTSWLRGADSLYEWTTQQGTSESPNTGGTSKVRYATPTWDTLILKTHFKQPHCSPDVDTFYVRVGYALSLASHNPLGIAVYPQPSDGNFSVIFPKEGHYELTAYDISGRKLWQETRFVTATEAFKVALPAGMYYLHVRKDDQLSRLPLLIMPTH
ncbi:MAG: T9SS type A sorting domain-containing protein [Bacteroidia bacterium]